MGLIIIGLLIVLIFGIIGAVIGYDEWDDWSSDKHRVKGFFLWVLVSGIITGGLVFLIMGIASSFLPQPHDTTYSQPLASLSDGKGVQGTFYGSFFLRRGQLGDTQNFSYYRVVAPNQYVLEKRDAVASTIWTDADAGTAHVDITDRSFSCQPTWYTIFCDIPATQFIHADFHVPAGSIQETFELDAQ